MTAPGVKDEAPDRRRGRERAAWVAVGLLTLAFAMALLLPLRTVPFEMSLDSSWSLVLHTAYERGLRFGGDIAFTYGPLGFLGVRSYHPATFAVLFAARALFAAVFWWALVDSARRLARGPGAALPWIAAVTAVCAFGPEQFFLSLPAVLLAKYFFADGGARSASTLLLAAALGAVGLIKFSWFIAAAVAVAAVGADEALVRRRVPLAPVVSVAAFLAAWLLAGQSLADLPAYFGASLELAGAYSEAMAVWGPRWEAPAFLLAAGLTLAAFAAAARRLPPGAASTFGRAIPVVGFAILLFAVFKAGYVRHHVLAANLTLLAIALIVLPALWLRRSGRASAALGVLGVAASAGLAVYTLAHYGEVSLAGYLRNTVVGLPSRVAAGARLLSDAAGARKEYEASIAEIASGHPLPALSGAADLYPNTQSILLANGLAYRPRPVFQSYAAYTPALAARNAEHLRGARAPEVVLFSVETIDNRYPALDDAPSWPELLTRYAVAHQTREFLVLERDPEPREYRLEPAGEVEAALGAAIEVPSPDAPVWASVDVRPTLAGRAAAVLFKLPLVTITVATRDGEARRYRLNPSAARGGFLLSPLVADRHAFAALASPSWRDYLADARVERVTVSVDPGSEWAYRPEVRFAFSRLAFSRRPPGPELGLSSYGALKALAASATRVDAPPRVIQGPEGFPILLAQPTSACRLSVSPDAAAVDVRFGLLDAAWGGGRTDGVEFRVSAELPAGPVVLWSRTLDPARVAGDRGPQSAEIALPPGGASLLFETLPVGSTASDWAYWSRVEVR